MIALAFAMGQTGTSPKARAADPLPDTIAAADIGDGGLDVETVRLLAEDEGFRAWTAKDFAGNVCGIPEAAQTGMNGSFCVAEAAFGERGLSGSILSEPSYDPNATPYLQVYLLPDGADSEAAAKLIPDARAF
ncbi:MAG: hypothetical protein J0H64_00380, partial [Actinobacteria bacterium]|nr:hypothetical protein [Actinomycetota bacterium]